MVTVVVVVLVVIVVTSPEVGFRKEPRWLLASSSSSKYYDDSSRIKGDLRMIDKYDFRLFSFVFSSSMLISRFAWATVVKNDLYQEICAKRNVTPAVTKRLKVASLIKYLLPSLIGSLPRVKFEFGTSIVIDFFGAKTMPIVSPTMAKTDIV